MNSFGSFNSNKWSAITFLLIILLGTLVLSDVPFLVSHHSAKAYEGMASGTVGVPAAAAAVASPVVASRAVASPVVGSAAVASPVVGSANNNSNYMIPKTALTTFTQSISTAVQAFTNSVKAANTPQ